MRVIRRTVLLTLALAGCAEYSRPSDKPAEERANLDIQGAPVAAPASEAVAATNEGFETTQPADLHRATADPTVFPSMIIRSGQASLQVDSLELAVDRLRQLAARLGGYVANSQVQAGQNQLRSGTLELKVPAARFDDATSGLSPIGKVEYINVAAEDVGEEFTDIAARVANAHRLEGRLIDLLTTRTGKLSDVLQIERELARVREEIERMEGRLRYLKTRVATSTLTVTVHEPAPLVGEPGSGGVVAESFRQAWRNFLRFLAGFVESLGFLIPLGVLVIGGLLGLRRLWRARRQAAG
jgi:hypothetical protein